MITDGGKALWVESDSRSEYEVLNYSRPRKVHRNAR